MIDIIITCFYKDECLENVLNKISIQEKKDRINKIIIINDSSPNTTDDYQSVIDKFKNDFKIQYLKTPYHYGCGKVRQMALSYIESKYFIFHDDDDELYHSKSLNPFFNYIDYANENNIEIGYINGGMIYASKEMDVYEDAYFENQRNITFALLNKDIIIKHNLSFKPIPMDEDVLFLDLYLYTLEFYYKDAFIETLYEPLYIINSHNDSICNQGNQKMFFYLQILRIQQELEFLLSLGNNESNQKIIKILNDKKEEFYFNLKNFNESENSDMFNIEDYLKLKSAIIYISEFFNIFDKKDF